MKISVYIISTLLSFSAQAIPVIEYGEWDLGDIGVLAENFTLNKNEDGELRLKDPSKADGFTRSFQNTKITEYSKKMGPRPAPDYLNGSENYTEEKIVQVQKISADNDETFAVESVRNIFYDSTGKNSGKISDISFSAAVFDKEGTMKRKIYCSDTSIGGWKSSIENPKRGKTCKSYSIKGCQEIKKFSKNYPPEKYIKLSKQCQNFFSDLSEKNTKMTKVCKIFYNDLLIINDELGVSESDKKILVEAVDKKTLRSKLEGWEANRSIFFKPYDEKQQTKSGGSIFDVSNIVQEELEKEKSACAQLLGAAWKGYEEYYQYQYNDDTDSGNTTK